ncbi:MAG TPA: dienelactone hydrolase, partial [Marinobacter sp.]|nr:dienelactone hydrolase [Marinobacter sp.]
ATRDMEQVKARFIKAKELLQNHESVDAGKIAAQGYCFGGAVVLNMARMGVDLDG